jgi:hypothetical protein
MGFDIGHPYAYTRITTATTTYIRADSCVLGGIFVENGAGSDGSVAIYDSNVTTGAPNAAHLVTDIEVASTVLGDNHDALRDTGFGRGLVVVTDQAINVVIQHSPG